MAATSPPTITAAPTPAPQRGDRSTFSTRVDAFVTWLISAVTQFAALGTNVYNNAVDAFSSATTATTQAANAAASAANAAASAASAAAIAGATAWVSGATYTLNQCAISQVDFQTYRHTTSSSSLATDPKNDATNWTRVVMSGGSGGTTTTGSVTLTAASPAAMVSTPATPGTYTTLPDATTCAKGVTLFSEYNAGDYDRGIKDAAGNQLGWIRPRTGAVIGLSDSSTAAGVWAYYGLEKTGVTAQYSNATVANMASNVLRRIALDATRTAFLFGGVDCYVIAYDSSSQTWGTATLVRVAIKSGVFVGVLQTTNQILVCTCDSTTAFEAVTITFSGTTPTVNSGTKGTATLAGNISNITQLIAVGTSWVVGYARATTQAGIMAITVSGTTPTVGSESALIATSTNTPIIFAAGSIVRTISFNNSTSLQCAPFTVSGSTLSAGTAATVSTTLSGSFPRAFLNGNGNIVCQYDNTTHYVTVFKLTGTTEVASSVSLGTAAFSMVSSDSDYIQVTASKTCFATRTSASSFAINILTDTAGTATAGTEYSKTTAASLGTPEAIISSGNMARFYLPTTGLSVNLVIDCSGTSPSVSSLLQITNGATMPSTAPSDRYGVRSPMLLNTSNSSTIISGGAGFAYDLVLTANAVNKKIALAVATVGVTGSSSNESFYVAGYMNSSATTGVTLTRVEAAA